MRGSLSAPPTRRAPRRWLAGVLLALAAAVLAPTAAALDLPASVTSVTEAVAPVADPVVEAVAPVVEPVVEAATPVVEPVVEAAAPVVEPAVEAAAPVVEAVAQAASPVVEPVVEVAAPVVESVAEAAAPVAEAVAPAVETAAAAVAPLTEAAADAVEPIVQAAEPVPSAVPEAEGPAATTVATTPPPGRTGGDPDPVGTLEGVSGPPELLPAIAAGASPSAAAGAQIVEATASHPWTGGTYDVRAAEPPAAPSSLQATSPVERHEARGSHPPDGAGAQAGAAPEQRVLLLAVTGLTLLALVGAATAPATAGSSGGAHVLAALCAPLRLAGPELGRILRSFTVLVRPQRLSFELERPG
jgi:hypothetical protein